MIDEKVYRDKWLSQTFDEFVGFYNREIFCLDNFSSFGFDYNGVYYPTVEHAYQSLKFKGVAPEIEKQIIECHSAYDAQRIARENADKQLENWHDIKVDVMEQLVRAKLAQYPYIKKKLLETKDYKICEDSPKDAFWGIGPNRDGRNELGKIWMKLRDELKNQNI